MRWLIWIGVLALLLDRPVPGHAQASAMDPPTAESEPRRVLGRWRLVRVVTTAAGETHTAEPRSTWTITADGLLRGEGTLRDRDGEVVGPHEYLWHVRLLGDRFYYRIDADAPGVERPEVELRVLRLTRNEWEMEQDSEYNGFRSVTRYYLRRIR